MPPRRLLALVILSVIVPAARAVDSPPVPPDVQPALSPAESRKSLKIAGGLDFELVASEPTVQQPLSISFDDRGRLWVLQYLQYPIPNGLKAVEVDQYLRTKYDRLPEPPPEGPRGSDRIIILEAPDGDGDYRKSKDFVSGLDLASGMALGYDGLYVVQPPYLLFYADRNHDDVPDGDPEVLLKGFGMEDAHAFANSLTWGPDGWLYGAQGSTVTASIRGIEFQQGIWRYHPRTRQFELFAEGGGNTWGIDFDRHGQLFAGGNTREPLCHHVQGGYYIKGFDKHGPLHNPYTFGYINALEHRGFLGSGLTGGFVIYQAGLFPDRFNDAVIYSNLRANAMRVGRLEPVGSTFTTVFQEDFVVSSDRWFRPVKSLVGPDRALYVADWYDYNISHSNPKDRSQWYLPNRESGRIWRVKPAGSTPRADLRFPLSKLSSDELVGLLASPNEWTTREARRILMERRDPTVCPRLERMVRSETDAKRALESLWALYVSGGFRDDLALELLDHPVDHVRAWTVRLLGDRRQVDARFHEKLVALAGREPSPTVRNQLACTCKRLPAAVALPAVAQLLGRAEDVADIQIPLLLWWAIEDKALSDRARVLALVDTEAAWSRPIMCGFVAERLARRYLAEATAEGYATCARLVGLAPTAADRERLVRGMEQQMEGLHLESPPDALAAALGPMLDEPEPSSSLVRLASRLGLESAYPAAVARAVDARRPAAERAEFIRTLGELKRPAALKPLLSLIGGKESAAVRAAALVALQRYESPAVAAGLIAEYPQMPSALKDKVRDVLASRPAWCAAMLEAVESEAIPARDFTPDQIRRVVLHNDAPLTARSEKLWGQVRPATSFEKRGRIQAIAQLLAKGPGDSARGKSLVVKNCLNCHQLFGEGEKLAPDLTVVDRKNLDVLLQNVVDPSGIIREGYQQYVLATTDGRVLAGLLAENSGGKVTVLDAKGVRTPLRENEVESIRRADTSIMPEGILDTLSDQELRDFFAYLRAEPGALPATPRLGASTR
jgi:putative heme-binding domain-containing protein